MFQTFLLITVLTLALFAILSDNLLRSNIYLGVFSLTMALIYLHYNAPDVALAEAAIGVGLSTVMYLVALKKITVYDICFVNEGGEVFDDDDIGKYMSDVIRPLETFIEKIEEIEPQTSYTNRAIEEVINDKNHDFIILQNENEFILYGHESDEVYQHIKKEITDIIKGEFDIEFKQLEEVVAYGTETNE